MNELLSSKVLILHKIHKCKIERYKKEKISFKDREKRKNSRLLNEIRIGRYTQEEEIFQHPLVLKDKKKEREYFKCPQSWEGQKKHEERNTKG